MSILPDIPICVLAGGASERFGSNKALAILAGKPLINHVIDKASGQTSGAIAINTNDRENFAKFDLPLVEDVDWMGQGPLSGILAALQWASELNCECLATIAVDLPFLPKDLIQSLSPAGAPSIATSGGRWHPVTGLWRCDQADNLKDHLASGRHSAHSWAEECDAKLVDFSIETSAVDPFWNVNSREDLVLAEKHLSL